MVDVEEVSVLTELFSSGKCVLKMSHKPAVGVGEKIPNAPKDESIKELVNVEVIVVFVVVVIVGFIDCVEVETIDFLVVVEK